MKQYAEFSPIKTFSPLETISIVDFFRERISSNYELISSVEEKYLTLQKEFDIYHPNISFRVGDFIYNSESSTIDFGQYLQVNINNTYSTFYSAGVETAVVDETVLHTDRAESAVGYLSQYFLSKSIPSHSVYWLYDSASIEALLSGGYENNQDEILTYNQEAEKYFLKVGETFPKLFVEDHDVNNQMSIMSKHYCELEYNNKMDGTVLCSTKVVNGDSFNYNDGDLFLRDNVSIDSYRVSPSASYVRGEMSPIEFSDAEKIILKKDISNTVVFNVRDAELEDRGDDEIVSYQNILREKDTLLGIDTKVVPVDFSVENSSGTLAVNFKTLHSILRGKTGDFFAKQLQMYVNGYNGDGPLGELISALEERIAELISQYASPDACAETPIDNVDEPCAVDCENLNVGYTHDMLTKQRGKMFLSCMFSCDGGS